MTQEKLNEILVLHDKWLNGETGGEQADLSNSDLSEADLSFVDLSYTIMKGTDLSGANMHKAVLHKANLRGAILKGANLASADLSWSDLTAAEMAGANLYNSFLRCTNLYGTILKGANLFGACLYAANLGGAILEGSNLLGALPNEYTKFDKANLEKDIPQICPTEGAFIGWKKARDNYIIKLKITEDSKRSSALGRECRCSKAVVLGIENIDGTPSGYDSISSVYDTDFVYEIGKTVEVYNFCEDRLTECAPGIHFFITRQEAVNYYY